jgi:hypothetical protein
MNSRLKDADVNPELKDPDDERFSHFAVKLRVVEHRLRPGLLWDRDYPEKPIYDETLEIRVGDVDPAHPGDEVQYRWLSEAGAWNPPVPREADGGYRIALRAQGALSGTLAIKPGPWPDPALTRD